MSGTSLVFQSLSFLAILLRGWQWTSLIGSLRQVCAATPHSPNALFIGGFSYSPRIKEGGAGGRRVTIAFKKHYH